MKANKTHLTWALLVISFLITSCLSPALLREAAYTPGIYVGSGQGLRGAINVRLEISTGGIVDIEIVGHRETAFPGLAAMEELLEMVLEMGSTDLDFISGATFSSRGFLEAVDDALRRAAVQ